MLRFAPDAAFKDYTRTDAYLKDDAEAKKFINNQPVDNAVPPHFMLADIRQGDPVPPTLETMAAILGKRGFAHAIDTYDSLKAKEPSFSMDAHSMNGWGYQLLKSGRKKQAVEIFKLAVHTYPDNGNLFDSLGEAYQAIGNKELSIKHYRRALELDPKNQNAAYKLKQLELR